LVSHRKKGFVAELGGRSEDLCQCGFGQSMDRVQRHNAELLTLLIEDFEQKHYSSKPATGIEALEELMEANRLKQKDLVSIFGTPSIISEVLNGTASTYHRTHPQAQPSFPRLARAILLRILRTRQRVPRPLDTVGAVAD
jgi:hypothetical protein